MRRQVLLTAALVAAVFLFVVLTLPPRPVPAAGTVDDDLRRRTIAGAVHVHSTRSDGTGSVDEIAAAANRAGLRFVVITDHGDASRPPDPPQYRHGVLVIDAVEISTNQGHVIALDLPAAPYPLGGEARDVVEDVRRLGGFAIAAHPESSKPELRWTARDAPIDGVEWINLDSAWRDESRLRLVRAAIDYPLGPPSALASLLDRPGVTLDRWDAMTERRAVVAVAGHDAHGGVAEGGRGGWRRRLGVPSYEASFRTFALRTILPADLRGSAADDARVVVEAIKSGRTFTAIDAVATPAFIDFRAAAAGVPGLTGQTIPFAAGATVTVRATVPDGGRLVLFRGGSEVAQSTTDELTARADAPGAYRVEVRAGTAPGDPPVPWLVTNPIYLRAQPAADGEAGPQAAAFAAIDGAGAVVEKEPESEGTISKTAAGFSLAYRLRSGDRVSQYVAAALPMPQNTDARALEFVGRSSSPMRLSVQLRFNELGGARWVRSVYLSPEPNRIVVPFAEMVPADRPSKPPQFPAASSILFVVDLTNAAPGQSGAAEISGLSLAK
ncbi:MAG TPA: CehA/McbA family metallohydrolase [Solirubrobacterales bacterium]|nr:CehA/McbA family metallohydrolase [Solirubrobacterales bacterium]